MKHGLTILLLAASCAMGTPAQWLAPAQHQTSATDRATVRLRPGRRLDSLDDFGRCNATNHGSVTISTNGWKFNGQGDYVDFGKQTLLEPGTNSFAVSIWALNTNPVIASRGMAGKLVFGGIDRWGLYGAIVTNNFSGQLYDSSDPSGPVSLASGRPIGTNDWHHYMQIFTRTSHQIFYDGSLVATGIPPASYDLVSTDAAVTAYFMIGAFWTADGSATTNAWQGYINSATVWKGTNIPTGLAEVTNIYRLGSNPP